MTSLEPTLESLPHPLQRYFLATRPAFLSVAMLSAFIGLASAAHDGLTLAPLAALVSVLFAMVAHAGANVLNDYYDELNGTDRLNTARLYPFTGGSRFIQNGVLSARQTLAFGLALMVATALAGLWLLSVCGVGLVPIGVLGGFFGWSYSAPPFRLNSRGFGELCIVISFSLIAVGADYVQRGTLAGLPFAAVTGFALLATNILYINQFPDRAADALAGKRHWVVRLPLSLAPYGYVMIAALAYALPMLFVLTDTLPPSALAVFLSAPLSLKAASQLHAHAATPERLLPAIRQTILAAHVHGAIMALALMRS